MTTPGIVKTNHDPTIASGGTENGESNYRSLRICCWCVALALGAAQAWATRFTMNPDGVSYLDIGDAYWRGDWHNALNAYWSPLYSWILGFFLKVLKPSLNWEYPLVHLVNFLIYAATLACFEFFLATFIGDRKRRDQELARKGQVGLPESSWWLLGYSLFISSSLILIGLSVVTPDMCVAALVYVASALILRISTGAPNRQIYFTLGLVLGIAYMAKAVMFPLAFAFLAVAIFAAGPSRNSLRDTTFAALVFLAIGAPLIAAISFQKERLTFGESGSWNYSFYVNHAGYLVANSPLLKHPIRSLSLSYPVYEFAQPIAGTFPPWYDPTYWHEGIRPHLTLRGEGERVFAAAILYALWFFVLFLSVAIGACILHFSSESPWGSLSRSVQGWMIAVPALAALALYSLVHVEGRFIASQLSVLFLVTNAGVSLPPGKTRIASFTVSSATAILALMCLIAWNYGGRSRSSEYWKAAAALHEVGIQSYGSIGLIWNERWDGAAGEGAFVPRLLRLKIVAEAPDADAFWKLDAAARNDAIAQIRTAGASAILAYRIPANLRAGWTKLGDTDYYALLFLPEQ